MIVPNLINSAATCGIIAPKEQFEDVNPLQTWTRSDAGKLNVSPQSHNMVTSLISLIDYLLELPSETGHILHFLFHSLWQQSNTPGSVISYFVNSPVENCTSGASSSSTSSTLRSSSILSYSSSLSYSSPIFYSDTSSLDVILLSLWSSVVQFSS